MSPRFVRAGAWRTHRQLLVIGYLRAFSFHLQYAMNLAACHGGAVGGGNAGRGPDPSNSSTPATTCPPPPLSLLYSDVRHTLRHRDHLLICQGPALAPLHLDPLETTPSPLNASSSRRPRHSHLQAFLLPHSCARSAASAHSPIRSCHDAGWAPTLSRQALAECATER